MEKQNESESTLYPIFPNQFQIFTAKSVRLYLKENIGNCLHDVNIAHNFLNKLQKALIIVSN